MLNQRAYVEWLLTEMPNDGKLGEPGRTDRFLPWSDGVPVECSLSPEKAAESGNPSRTVAMLVKPSCLIVDEVGRCTFDHACTYLFFNVIDRRYEKDCPNTMILTSNTPANNRDEFIHRGRHAPLRARPHVRPRDGVHHEVRELPWRRSGGVLSGSCPSGNQDEQVSIEIIGA